MALVYVLFEPGQTAMVFGPQNKTFPAVAAADAQILSSGEGFLVVRGTRSGYVRKLYSGGAMLVMPTTEMMCGHPGAIRKIATEMKGHRGVSKRAIPDPWKHPPSCVWRALSVDVQAGYRFHLQATKDRQTGNRHRLLH